ncbi:uncharacterized protein [Petaurus breviceps papuanus]|uniref:uncharacterized protein n=1 Tax=Petaurus breviceps papuanus TaxID=3040969 RepID=UPI0036D9561B
MQAAGAWLPLLLLHTSKGQNLTQICSQDLHNNTCSCLLPHDQQNCPDHKLSTWAIVGITLGLLLLLAMVIVGTVLGIRRKRWWDAPEPCPWKPSEDNLTPGWQARYGSQSSRQLTVASTPSSSAALGPSSSGTLLYENLFLGSQPSHQSRGSLPDPEAVYMNYEDSPRTEHPIYGNVDNVTCTAHPQEPPHPGAEDEDDYVVPGC